MESMAKAGAEIAATGRAPKAAWLMTKGKREKKGKKEIVRTRF